MWQTLAPELVFEIFRRFLPGLTLSVTEPKLFPWYLGQICGSWRSVLISHAGFWSNLIVKAEFYDVQRAKHALQMLKLCLLRSNDRPLSFNFKSVLPQPSDNSSRRARKTLSKRCLQKMLNLLIGESTRWRDAYITIRESELPILYKINHKLPMLRSAQIQLSYTDGSVARPPLIYEDLLENAPQLRRLYIHQDPSWKVDWSALTVIFLWYPSSVAEYLDIRVSRLEELTIRDAFTTLPILPNTVPPKTLPFLKILRTDSVDVLFRFRTPVLQELWIESGEIARSDAISMCLPTLLHLTKLTLIAMVTSDVEIILQHMPALPDLTLYVYRTDCLKLLSECPKLRCLKTLTVCLLSDDEDHWANITTWVKRTSLPHGVRYFEGLEYLTLEFSEMPGHSCIAVLKEHLEAEGIRNSIQVIRTKYPMFDDLFQP
jgi:hypothetical protein